MKRSSEVDGVEWQDLFAFEDDPQFRLIATCKYVERFEVIRRKILVAFRFLEESARKDAA